jgi:hypothetical protein
MALLVFVIIIVIFMHTHTLFVHPEGMYSSFMTGCWLSASERRASEFITQMTYYGALKVCTLPVNVSRNCSQHPGPPTHDKIAGASCNQNKTSYVYLTCFIKPGSEKDLYHERVTVSKRDADRRADPKTLLLESSSDQDVLLNGRHYISLHGALKRAYLRNYQPECLQRNTELLIKSSLPLLLPYSPSHFHCGETFKEEIMHIQSAL